jgi:hypothetical protein
VRPALHRSPARVDGPDVSSSAIRARDASSSASISRASASTWSTSPLRDDNGSGSVGVDVLAGHHAHPTDHDRHVGLERRQHVAAPVSSLTRAIGGEVTSGQFLNVAQPPVGQHPGQPVLVEPGQLGAAGHRGVRVPIAGEHENLAGRPVAHRLVEQVGEVVALRVQRHGTAREVGDGGRRTEQDPAGRGTHQIEHVATMPVGATHSVDQIGAREATERVCAVSGRAHRRVHMGDLLVVEHHMVLVLATGAKTSPTLTTDRRSSMRPRVRQPKTAMVVTAPRMFPAGRSPAAAPLQQRRRAGDVNRACACGGRTVPARKFRMEE